MDRLLRQGGRFQQTPGHIEDVHPDVFWWRTVPQDLETILKEMKTDHSALSEVKFLLLSWLGAQNRIKLYYRKIALCAVLAWRPRLRYVHSLSENAGTKEDRGTKSADLLESHWVLPGAAGEAPRVHSVFPLYWRHSTLCLCGHWQSNTGRYNKSERKNISKYCCNSVWFSGLLAMQGSFQLERGREEKVQPPTQGSYPSPIPHNPQSKAVTTPSPEPPAQGRYSPHSITPSPK